MLDLMDGVLSPSEEAALHLFLEENPDLDDSFPELTKLAPADQSFPNKTSLFFEEVNEENRTFFFISFKEDLLVNEQREQLNTFLKTHPQYQEEFEQYQRASLVAEDIKFEHKDSLIFKQDKGWIISIRPIYYAAAAIVFFLFSYATIQFLQSDKTELYVPTELALDKIIYTPEQEDLLESAPAIQNTPEKVVPIAKKQQQKNGSGPSVTPPNKVEENIAHKEINPNKNNDSLPAPRIEPTPNQDIANNTIQLPSKQKAPTKAPSIGELIVQNAKDKLYNNPNAPEKDEFDSEIAALASAGMSAISNKEQYINRTVNDTKKTKVSIGGFSFERVKH